MSPPVVLWDVDGTLLLTRPVGMQALAAGISATIGRAPVMEIVDTGRTERWYLRTVLTASGVPEAELAGTVDGCLDGVRTAFTAHRERLATEGVVLPGVPAVLAGLAERGALQTLLTGNIREVGALKVGALGLADWFDFDLGAYGCECEDRDELGPLALGRVAGRLGAPPDPRRVWVVGDTPHDLACARAAGVRCLLVATGRHPYDELAALDADAVLPDMSDVSQVLELLAPDEKPGGSK
jgi:phosphoglycolate phosphatase